VNLRDKTVAAMLIDNLRVHGELTNATVASNHDASLPCDTQTPTCFSYRFESAEAEAM
jgi:hypothetical protein